MERFLDIISRWVLGLTRRQKSSILLCVDALLAPISLLLTVWLFGDSFRAVLQATANTALVATLAGVSAVLSVWLGLPRIKLNSYEQSGIFRTTIFAIGVGFVGFVGLRLQVAVPQITQAMVVFTMVLLILAVGTRIMMRVFLVGLYQRGTERHRVLIYGAGQTGVQLATALGRDDAVIAVAFIDDNPTLHNVLVSGLPVYSPLQIDALVEQLRVDRVVVAMPSISRPKQAQIARKLTELGCEVSVLPSFATLVGEGDLLDRIQPFQPADFLNRRSLENELDGLCDAYTGKIVMITGAGGSIGSELARQVLECGPSKLILFEINELALYQLKREIDELKVSPETEILFNLGSVMDADHVQHTLAAHEVDIILHAAAYKHVTIVEENPLAGIRNNVMGTKILAEAARDAGVERFILISTDKAVRPTNMMGASKRLAEMIVQDLANRSDRTRFALVRFGNVLGSSGSVVPLFNEQIERGGPVTLTHPDVTRYFMTINEAVRLVLMAGNFAEGGDIFVLDMGNPVPIRKLAEQMIETAGFTVKDKANPDGDIEISIIGLSPGEKLHEELANPSFPLSGTEHPKIHRASELALSQIEVASAVKALSSALDEGSVDAARAVVKRWVNTYNLDDPTPSEAKNS